jgi:hypothetical protein
MKEKSISVKRVAIAAAVIAVAAVANSPVASANPDPCYLAGALGDRNPLCPPPNLSGNPWTANPNKWNDMAQAEQDRANAPGAVQVPKRVIVPGA